MPTTRSFGSAADGRDDGLVHVPAAHGLSGPANAVPRAQMPGCGCRMTTSPASDGVGVQPGVPVDG
jgi:hypothetical protein